MEALKAGVGALEFWEMTPPETYMAIEAATWRMEHEQRLMAWTAWHVAALSRAKKLPSLTKILTPPEAKKLTPDEAATRRKEFEDMKKGLPSQIPIPDRKTGKGKTR